MTPGARARAAARAPGMTPAPSRRRAWAVGFAAAVLVAAGCGGGGAASRASRPPATASSSSSSLVGSVDPCVVARQQRARVPGLLGEGKLHRTLRVLAEADRRCPAERPVTWAVEVEALAELGRCEAARELARAIEGDPRAAEGDRAAARRALALVAERRRAASDPEVLYAAARDAKRARRAAEAQRLLDRAVNELERATGAEVTTDAPERMYPASVTWSPDGTLLAVTDGMDVVVREVATLRERVRLGGHGSAVSSVAFSPDGSTLVTGSYDRAVRQFRLQDGAALRTLAEHDGPVMAVALSGDGSTLVSAAFDGVLRRTRVADGAALGPLPAPQEHVLTVPSPDGVMVAVVLRDGSLSLRRARDGEVLHDLVGDRLRIASLTFSPDGGTLVVGAADGSLRLWRVRDGVALHRLDQATGSSQASLALSPDGSLIALGLSGAVRILRTRDGAVLHDVPAPRRDASVRSVAFSPDGGTLFTATSDGTVRSWRVRDGSAPLSRAFRDDPVGVAFSPDVRRVAVKEHGGTVQLFDLSDGSPVSMLAADDGLSSDAVAFSPDGTLLASGSGDGVVRLWRVDDGELLRTLEVERTLEPTTTLSPDGRSALFGVRTTGSILLSLAFAPDGGTLAATSVRGGLRCWSLPDGRLLFVARGVTGADAGYVSTPSGHCDFVGAEPDRAEERVLCRVGPLAFPFELCAERFRVPGLLAKAHDGDESYLEP